MKTRILSTVLALMMILSTVAFVGCGKKSFDYAGKDLSEYISYIEADYKKLPIEIQTDVDSAAVIDDIIGTLDSFEGDKRAELFASDRAIKENDIVAIYYRGVTADEEGKELGFDGGTNFGNEKPTLLWIGSDRFIEGFEDGLIGILPSETSITKRLEGFVEASDTVILDIYGAYGVEDKEGKKKSYMDYEDLAVKLDETEILSEDIINNIVNKSIGDTIVFDLQIDADGDKILDTVVFSAKIKSALDIEAKKISVKFPDDYGEASLKGKEAFFYVVIEELASMDKETISKLGFETEEEDALTAYKESVKADLIKKYAEKQAEDKENFKALIQNAIWKALTENVKVESYPAGTIDSYIKTEKNNLEYDYYAGQDSDSLQASYKTLEEYAKAYYGDADYEKVMKADAEAFVLGKLTLYSIAKDLGVDNVTKADKKAVKAEIKEAMVEYYKQYFGLYNSIFGYGYTDDEIKDLAEYNAQASVDGLTDTYVTESAMKKKILDKIYEDYNTDFDGGLITWVAVAEEAAEEETEEKAE